MSTFTHRRRRLALPTACLALAAALGTGLAQAGESGQRADAVNCWATPVEEPISSENLPVRHASYAPFHRAMDTLAAELRANPGVNALPEVRLRFKREVNAATFTGLPHNASLHLGGFGPKAWGRGPCEVIPQADRLGARVGISVFINTPLATLNTWAQDEHLTAYLEGERGEAMHGWPVYRGCAVITHNRRLWWQPVTVGEMLAYYAREQQRRIDEHERSNRHRFDKPFDLAAEEARIAELRKLGPQAQRPADLALMAARQRKALEPQMLRQLTEIRQAMQAELDALNTFRTGLDAVAAAEPYRLGTGRFRMPLPREADRPLKRLVKLDPGFGWDGSQRTRIQALHVCPSMLEHNPTYGPVMRQAVSALDFRRIAALLN